MGKKLETLDTKYVNVVVKVGDGKSPLNTIVSKIITSDCMATYIGLQKVFRAYYANRLLTIIAAHDKTLQIGDVVEFITGQPELDTYWQIISKTMTINFDTLEDSIVLQSKRGEKRK